MPSVDPALALLQSAVASARPPDDSDPGEALLAQAAQDGTVTGPASAPFKPASPTGSFVENLAAGAGSKLADWGLGAEQIAANIGAKLDPSRFGGMPAQLAAQAAEKRKLDAPLLNTWGGSIGSNATAMAPAFIPGMQGLGAMTAIGAAQGALNPTTAGQSRLLNTTLGGAFGAGGKLLGDAAGGWLSRRVGSTFAPALTDAQKAALQQGEALGMRATPGQLTGSKPLQQAEVWAQSHPWTSGPLARVAAGNQGALDKAAAQAIGENDRTVDATVLGRANDRLGNVFESVRNPSHIITFNPQATKAALDGIDATYQGLLPNDMAIRDNSLVSQLDSLTANGSATAQQLGSLSSKLGKKAFKEMTSPSGDRDLAQALYAVKDHADDLLESSLSGTERAEYAAARKQYRNLMLLTNRTGIVNPSTGHVSGAALAQKLQQSDRSGFLFGNNQTPLYSAARFAQAFKPIVGDSGTATRMANPFDPLELLMGVPANLGTRLYASPLGRALVLGTMKGGAGLSRGAAAASRIAAPAVRYGLMGAGLDPWPLMSGR